MLAPAKSRKVSTGVQHGPVSAKQQIGLCWHSEKSLRNFRPCKDVWHEAKAIQVVYMNMKRSITALLVALCAIGLSACDVDKTQEGEAPKVEVEGGQLPKYDVDGPDVDVKSEEKQVTVPDVDVDVKKEEKTITVPHVDVKPAPAD